MPVAVFKKYGDDRGGSLSALVTFYGFLAVFPLLLLFVTIAGLVLRNNPTAEQRIVHSALSEFPVIGDKLARTSRPCTGRRRSPSSSASSACCGVRSA